MYAVENPEIPEVLDRQTGEHRSLADVVGIDYGEIVQLRTLIKDKQLDGEPLFACSVCGVSVSLMMHHVTRRFYFKHTREDGSCPQITRGELSREEINARKYNGAKESSRHLRMKELLAISLAADPSFSDIRIEERWAGELTGEWRQPDVRATYNGIKVVFEVQLSTTYLDVIVERRRFYQREGALLCWIFSDFRDDSRRLLQDDVFYNNNQNAFLVSEDTAMASKAAHEFRLVCAWAEPTSGHGLTPLKRTTVAFRELVLDVAAQQAYYFDFAGARAVLVDKESNAVQRLRDQFETAWIEGAGVRDGMGRNNWGRFGLAFRAQGVTLPVQQNHLHNVLINALYSAKHGRVIGWRHKKFIEIAHRIATGHKGYLRIFRKALGVYDRGAQIIEEDKSGSFKKRAKEYKLAIAQGDEQYAADTTHDELLRFLFPELFDESGG